MKPTVVLFEDHTLRHFRPVSWSLPVTELRVGMFNLRERTELAGGRGALLTRPYLAPLHTCADWSINPRQLDAAGPVLWLNGRCRLSVTLLEDLLQGLPGTPPFVHGDEHGPLVAWLEAADSAAALASWWRWAAGQADREHPAAWEGLQPHGTCPWDISALGYLFDVVPATAATLRDDALFLRQGRPWRRSPFGLFPAENAAKPVWALQTSLRPAGEHPEHAGRFPAQDPGQGRKQGQDRKQGQGIFLGDDVRLADGVVLDDSAGPVILDRGVQVMPFSYLEGPLYVGPGSRVKAGAAIYGESSFGIGNRIAGEIGESTFLDFANKQHDGFIGHAVIGSFTNLGAMTTCSDLKNNYGPVRVDLGFGTLDTGLRFVGLMMGDHAKTAIGTLFNTGTCVGFASNIFGGAMPPKFVPGFSWGGGPQDPRYDVQRAMATAEVVLGRRGCRMVPAYREMMVFLAGF